MRRSGSSAAVDERGLKEMRSAPNRKHSPEGAAGLSAALSSEQHEKKARKLRAKGF
jgi:hypothetical protein